jgi:hypothetical protein
MSDLDSTPHTVTIPSPPSPQQVESNLIRSTLIGARPVSRLTADAASKPSTNSVKINCYPSELQLQYSTVLSKPSTAASLLRDICNPSREGACLQEVGISPRFYNVRLQHVPCERSDSEASEDGELKVECKVDEQVG